MTINDLVGATIKEVLVYKDPGDGVEEPALLVEKDGEVFTVFPMTDDSETRWFHIMKGRIAGFGLTTTNDDRRSPC